MKKIVAAFITMLWMLAVPTVLQAQTEISGYVEDSLSHNRLPNVSITLLRNGKPIKFTRSKADGSFVLSVDERHVGDMLQATCMGYKKTKHRFLRTKKPLSACLPPHSCSKRCR